MFEACFHIVKLFRLSALTITTTLPISFINFRELGINCMSPSRKSQHEGWTHERRYERVLSISSFAC